MAMELSEASATQPEKPVSDAEYEKCSELKLLTPPNGYVALRVCLLLPLLHQKNTRILLVVACMLGSCHMQHSFGWAAVTLVLLSLLLSCLPNMA